MSCLTVAPSVERRLSVDVCEKQTDSETDVQTDKPVVELAREVSAPIPIELQYCFIAGVRVQLGSYWKVLTARRLVTSSMTSRDYDVKLVTSQSSKSSHSENSPDQLSVWIF